LSILNAKSGQLANLRSGQCGVDNRKLIVGCGEGTSLELVDVQLAGKKRMSGEAFLNGYKLLAEETLGAL
jgi:methionyl-tRNA formyltransferase